MAISALTASLSFSLALRGEKAQTALASLAIEDSKGKRLSFSTGVGAGQANEAYVAVRTLAAATAETLDLSAALTNVLGETNIALARIKALVIWLLAAADTVGEGSSAVTGTACSSVTVGAAAANAWQGPFADVTDALTIPNGGFVVLGRADATGWLVGAGANDQLKVLNNDGAVDAKYLLALIGAAT